MTFMVPHNKIVFTGPPGAGKTTAITAISDKPPVRTDVHNTDVTLDKQTTTVGMDFGELDFGDGERVSLFGTPGQDRFDFMWRVLARQSLGVVVLVDNTTAEPVQDALRFAKTFCQPGQSAALVVGVGRTEGPAPGPPLDDYCTALAGQGIVCPVFAVDVRRREDVLVLIDGLLNQVEASMDGVPSA